ncbi:DNA/RNA endonuclease G [Leucobacter chinensis]|uniref:DNA/RNA endonuclease G n=1 Tax=Leucobacter chinensis TaxID=2851010 RepID=UPI001C217ADD|nr:DNA/RNA endonuclease G [Leucobacter chinensis]
MSEGVLARVVRRETHSPRTVLTVVLLVVIMVAVAYGATELVLHIAGAAPLVMAPHEALAAIAGVPDLEGSEASVTVAIGVIAALVGLILLWLSFSSARRPRHESQISRYSVVVDNGVIASAVAENLRRELDLPKSSVVVGIGHRTADITIRPQPGQVVDRERASVIAQIELASYELRPPVKVRTRVVKTDERGEFS